MAALATVDGDCRWQPEALSLARSADGSAGTGTAAGGSWELGAEMQVDFPKETAHAIEDQLRPRF